MHSVILFIISLFKKKTIIYHYKIANKSGLREIIKNLYVKIEDSLNDNIFKLCQIYDEALYAKIISAYFSLGKIDNLFKQVNQNFVSGINLVSAQSLINIVIRKYIANENTVNQNTNTKANLNKINAYIEDLKKKDYSELFLVNLK